MKVKRIIHALRYLVSAAFRNTRCAYSQHNRGTVKILANGPSLKQDMGQLVDTDAILVLNNFFLDTMFWSLKPKFYVIVDPIYFEEKFWRGTIDEQIYDVISDIDWDITFYVPYKYLSYFKNKVSNKYIKIKSLYCPPYLHAIIPLSIELKLYKLGIINPPSQNVLIPAIYTMINAGYSAIYIYGADHSWTSQMCVDANNQVCLLDEHFYDNQKISKPWLKANGHPYKMHEILSDLQNTFSIYYKLQNYAKYIGGVSIINKTKNSFIDAFIKE